MDTQKKPIYKSLLFWEILILSVVILGLVISMLVVFNRVFRAPAATTQPTTEATTVPPTTTTAPPETTEPPLPVNPYGPSDFGYSEGYLSCTAGPSVLGIDVSVWQGNIDWEQVKEAGVEFAMIRVGWRGSEQGLIEADEMLDRNYAGASAAGIKVGAYFFSQAITPEEALEEAEFLLEHIQGWQVDMPVVFDWEFVADDARTATMDAETLTACAKAFCDRVRQAGYRPMIYFNEEQGQWLMHLEELLEYEFWLAMYTPIMDYPHKINMWQYSCEGSVAGIDGNVDLNLYFPYD